MTHTDVLFFQSLIQCAYIYLVVGAILTGLLVEPESLRDSQNGYQTIVVCIFMWLWIAIMALTMILKILIGEFVKTTVEWINARRK